MKRLIHEFRPIPKVTGGVTGGVSGGSSSDGVSCCELTNGCVLKAGHEGVCKPVLKAGHQGVYKPACVRCEALSA
jgi:hypothetical protein